MRPFTPLGADLSFVGQSGLTTDADFFTKLTKETNGTGSSSTSLILNDVDNWKKTVRGGERHAETISNNFELLKLFKELTTLKKSVNVPKDIEDYKVKDINQTKLIKFSEKYRLNI